MYILSKDKIIKGIYVYCVWQERIFNDKAFSYATNLREVLVKFKEIAEIVCGNPNAPAEEGVDWIKTLCGNLKLPPLSQFGLRESLFQELVKRAKKASSMKGNPVELGEEVLFKILDLSL